MRESTVEKYLVARVKAAQGEVRKVRWIARNGAPDRVVFFERGEIYWIELKRPRKVAEEHQEREHRRLRAMGQYALVLDSVEAVDAFFAKREEWING